MKEELAKKWKKLWRENHYLVRPYVVLVLVYLVGYLAILLAGVHYADDIARTNYGYAGWSAFSRYLSTILSHGVHAGNYLTNIAPLPQLLAIGLMALASLLVVCAIGGREVFHEKWTRWIWRVIAVTLLGFCPYFLECMSYQYDAVYMGLSVLAAVMPVCFRKSRKLTYMLAIAIGVLVVCMTYQVSLGILPMLIIFIEVKDWMQGGDFKKIAKSVGFAALVFIITVLVFKFGLMAPRDVYVSNSVPEIGEFFPKFFEHLGTYFGLILEDFRVLWLALVGMIMAGFIVMFTMRSRKRIVGFAVGMGLLVVMLVVAYAFYAALEVPLYTTRAMYPIGAVLAIMGVYIASGKKLEFCIVKAAAVIPVMVLCWCFFVFAFTYGNALTEQNAYRNMQVEMVMADLNEILPEMEKGEKIIQTSGQIGLASAVTHMPESEYRIVRRLLKPSFGGDVPWMAYRLTEMSGMPGLKIDLEMNLTEMKLPVIRDTVFYEIYGDEKYILVKFKGEEFGLKY